MTKPTWTGLDDIPDQEDMVPAPDREQWRNMALLLHWPGDEIELLDLLKTMAKERRVSRTQP